MDTSLYKDISTFLSLYRNVSTFLEPGHPPPKAEGYRFVHVRPSFRQSIRSHYYVTTERNFMKLILHMYHYNDVMHVKFSLAGLLVPEL